MPSKKRLGKHSPRRVLVSASSPSTDNQKQKRAEGGAPTTGDGSQSSGEVVSSLDQSLDQQELRTELPSTMLQSLPGPASTDAPRRILDLDEAAAAMALISLSCEAVVIIPTQEDSVAESGCQSLGYDVHPSMDMTNQSLTPPTDRGLFMDQDSVAYDDPPPRRQKLSPASPGQHLDRAAYREHSLVDLNPCLGGESDAFWRQQDLNSTEICPSADPFMPSAASNIPQKSTCTMSAAPAVQDVPEQGFLPSQPITLSQSAPAATATSFDLCTSPPSQAYISEEAPSSSLSSNPCGTSSSSPQNRQGFGDHEYFRRQTRSLTRLCSKSSHCGPNSSSKRRRKAWKCRKVYGINRRDKWCRSCYWKKACHYFPDSSDEECDQT